MHVIALSLFIFMSVANSSAGVFEMPDGTRWMTFDPPEKWFDVPYEGEIRIKIYEADHLKEVCSMLAGTEILHGCAQRWPYFCMIWVSAALPPDFQENIIRHEKAHCHGWPNTHPID